MVFLEYLDLGRKILGDEIVVLDLISISDISTLSQCKKLNVLNIGGHQGIKDLSPLCQCPDLEDLVISGLSLIKDLSFLEKGFKKLRVLDITDVPVDDLSPLTKLPNLEELHSWFIPLTTSLLPLTRCYKLKRLYGDHEDKALECQTLWSTKCDTWTRSGKLLLVEKMQALIALLRVDGLPACFQSHLDDLCGSLCSLHAPQMSHMISRCLDQTSDALNRSTTMLMDRCWEELHTGHWSKVEAAWRHAYSLSCLLHAASCPIEASGEAMRSLDLGIMMGGDSPFRGYLDEAIESLEKKTRGLSALGALEGLGGLNVLSSSNEPKAKRRRMDTCHLPHSSLASLPPHSLSYHRASSPLDPSSGDEGFKGRPPLVLIQPSLEDFLVTLMTQPTTNSPTHPSSTPPIASVGMPAVIEGMMDRWPAMTRWHDLNYLLDAAGHRTVPVELGRSYLDDEWSQALMPLREFIIGHMGPEEGEIKPDRDQQGKEEGVKVKVKCYLAQHPLFDQIPLLKKDLLTPDYCCLSTRGCDEGPG